MPRYAQATGQTVANPSICTLRVEWMSKKTTIRKQNGLYQPANPLSFFLRGKKYKLRSSKTVFCLPFITTNYVNTRCSRLRRPGTMTEKHASNNHHGLNHTPHRWPRHLPLLYSWHKNLIKFRPRPYPTAYYAGLPQQRGRTSTRDKRDRSRSKGRSDNERISIGLENKPSNNIPPGTATAKPASRGSACSNGTARARALRPTRWFNCFT